jgi:nucleoside-diphosphate-sugar epimerase
MTKFVLIQERQKLPLRHLGTRVKRYIFTSSMAVYGHSETEITEEAFNPYDYPYDLEAPQYTYDEGKCQAEAYFFQKASFPVVAVRVAMVVSGTDDYTRRFDYYVEYVAQNKSIGVLNTEHPITYVTAWDVAKSLQFIGTESTFEGPINAANSGYYSVQEISREIGRYFGVTPSFHVGSQVDKTLSPYAIGPATWKLSNGQATSLGFTFPNLRPSIQEMVKQSSERLGLGKN